MCFSLPRRLKGRMPSLVILDREMRCSLSRPAQSPVALLSVYRGKLHALRQFRATLYGPLCRQTQSQFFEFKVLMTAERVHLA